MKNSNENVLNKDNLTVAEESSEITLPRGAIAINILACGAVPYKDGIDIEDAKKKNAEALSDAIKQALPSRGFVIIPDGKFLLSKSIR